MRCAAAARRGGAFWSAKIWGGSGPPGLPPWCIPGYTIRLGATYLTVCIFLCFGTFIGRIEGKKSSLWDFLTFILDWRGRPLFGLCVLFGHFEVAFSKSAQISCLLLFDEISCLFVLKFEILWLRLRDWSADWSSAKKQNGSVTINWRLTIFKLSIIKRNNRGRNCSLQIWNCN